jgi:hypothetical protein
MNRKLVRGLVLDARRRGDRIPQRLRYLDGGSFDELRRRINEMLMTLVDPDCYAASALVDLVDEQLLAATADATHRGHVRATALRDFTWLMHSADVGLLIGVLGIGRVFGGERVEDELRGGVSIGARAISLGVQFSMSSLRGVAVSDEDADGLIDDRRRSQICPGVRPGRDAEVLIEREVAGPAAG